MLGPYETMIGRKKERFKIMALQIDNLKGLLGIRRMDRMPNTKIREKSGVMKGVDERIDEIVLQ